MIASFYTTGFGTIDIDHATGKATETLFGLAPNMGGDSTVVCNDAKCSPEGRYFAGQKELRAYDVSPPQPAFWKKHLPHVGKSTGAAKELLPALYRIDSRSKCTPVKAVGRLMCSNGPTWSKDGKTFWHVDSPQNVVMEFDYDKKTGTISNRRRLLKMNDEIGGIFDGASLDSKGFIWWAIATGSKVIKIDPRQKKVVEIIHLPWYKVPSSVAFGGDDYKTMLVTTIGFDGGAGKHMGGDNGGICVLKFTDGTKGLKPGMWKDKK